MKIADLGESQEFDGVDAFLTSTAGCQTIEVDIVAKIWILPTLTWEYEVDVFLITSIMHCKNELQIMN